MRFVHRGEEEKGDGEEKETRANRPDCVAALLVAIQTDQGFATTSIRGRDGGRTAFLTVIVRSALTNPTAARRARTAKEEELGMVVLAGG